MVAKHSKTIETVVCNTPLLILSEQVTSDGNPPGVVRTLESRVQIQLGASIVIRLVLSV
jgi:hypothetical protein